MTLLHTLRLSVLFGLALPLSALPVVATLSLGTSSVASAAPLGTPETVDITGQWVVTAPRSLARLKEAAPTMKIEGVGRFRSYSGSDSCNTYSGRLRILAHTIRFLPAMSTKKACPGTQDASFHALLAKAKRVDRDGQVLKFYSGDREHVLTLSPLPSATR